MVIRSRSRSASHVRQYVAAPLLALLLVGTAAPLLAQERESVGVTLAARGDVEATDLVDLEARMLRRRSEIFNVDRVVTGAGARAQMRMVDDAVISLREGSELVIAEYQFNADTGEGRAVMELVAGGLRTLSGQISPQSNNSDYELRTSAGSIGIRGTHFEVVVSNGNTLLGVWDGNIDVTPLPGRGGSGYSLGSDEEYSFAAVNPDGNVEFLLEPPEAFSDDVAEDEQETGDSENPEDSEQEAEADESSEEDEDSEQESGTEEAPEEDGDDTSGDDNSTGDDAEDGNSETDESSPGTDTGADTGDNSTGGSGQPGDAPVLSDSLLAALEPNPPEPNQNQNNRRRGTGSGDLDERIEEAEEQISPQPVNLVPTPATTVASRSGNATYRNPAFTLNNGLNAAQYDLTLEFAVNFAEQTVNDGNLELRTPTGNLWSGTFTGGIVGNELSIGSSANSNPLANAAYNGNPIGVDGWLNGTFFGAQAQQVRGDFGFRQNGTLQISGDYRVGEVQP